MSLTSFEVANYRAFVDPARVELKELTLLFGYNNAGKSALARVLPLLRDSTTGRRGLPLNLESATLRGGEFADLRSRKTGARRIELTLEWDASAFGRVRLVLQDLPERRQHVVESFQIDARDGSTVTGQWVAAEAIGPTEFDVRRDDGPITRAVIDWMGLIPRAQAGLPLLDEALIKALAATLEGLQATLWVGAVRAMQPRRDKFPRLQPDTIAENGLGAADVLAWDKKYGGEIFASVAHWYRENTETLLDVAIQADEYALATGSSLISLSDTGEGLTQVLPVLVAGAMAAQVARTRPSYLVVEQPELHLHPAAHAPLAKFFCDIAAADLPPRIVIETHSENFLFGVQLAIARGQLDPARVVIQWVRQEEGLATVTPIRMDADGRPDAWPRDVFTEEAELAKELYEAQRRRGSR